jgi:hypothetical protein
MAMQNATFKMQNTSSRKAGPFAYLAVLAFCILNLAFLASGCAKATAATVPNGPPLAMPLPPPREMPVGEVAAVPIGTPTADLPVASPGGRTSTSTAKPQARAPEAKPEPVAAQPPPPAAQPPAPAAAEAPRELRSAPSATVAAEERKVQDVLRRATAALKGVDFGKLSAERQTQYNQAKRFAEQAEEALKDRNIPFATTLADKAKQLADELADLR